MENPHLITEENKSQVSACTAVLFSLHNIKESGTILALNNSWSYSTPGYNLEKLTFIPNNGICKISAGLF